MSTLKPRAAFLRTKMHSNYSKKSHSGVKANEIEIYTNSNPERLNIHFIGDQL